MISAKLIGIKTVKGKLNLIKQATKMGCLSATDRVLRTIKNTANEFLEKNRKLTGYYENYRPEEKIAWNWKIREPYVYGDEVRGKISNLSDHAFFVEYGTSGPIRPTVSPYLRFIYNFRWVSKREVRGQPPKSFFRGAKQLAELYAKNYYRDAIVKRLGVYLK